jgi:2-phospho-L-lactate guanylyltransferase
VSVIWALVPVKELSQAKTRLASVLSADERRALMLAMLDDVLGALTGLPEITRCLVISRDSSAQSVALRRGALSLRESLEAGDLNAALREGIQCAIEGGATSVLIIPADVPATSASEIRLLISEATPAPSVSLVAAEDGDGTNALLLSPPQVIPLSYGTGSCLAHVHAGQVARATVREMQLTGLALDLDEPRDLAAFLQRDAVGATRVLLDGLDLPQRLLHNASQV